jgi:hypothetical protein
LCKPRCKTPTAAWAKASRWRPAFLLACVLWADVRDGWARRQERNSQLPVPGAAGRGRRGVPSRIGDVSGGGKLASDMREIWMMQPRFRKAHRQFAVWSGRAAALSARPLTSCACAPTTW